MGLLGRTAACWLLALASCRNPEGQPKAAPAPLASSAAPVLSASAAPESPPLPWAEALRADRYREAERAFRALPSDAQAAAEVRFARAKASLELGRPSEALPLLAGLEESLPVLAEQVKELRSKALLAGGPPLEAAKLLEQRGEPEALADAARAWLSAGDAERAFKLASRGMVGLGKGRKARGQEVKLRFARGLSAQKLDKQALWAADFRFVALEDPLSDEGKQAAEALAALGEKSPLSPADRLARARDFAAAGRSDELEAELKLIEPLGARIAKPGVFPALRAQAIFNSRGDYRAAEKLFQQASALGTEDAAKQLFYVAKSRARAQDDAGAEQGYKLVMQRFGTTSWAEQAELAVARIYLAAGDYDKAAAAYGTYLQKRGGRARYESDAGFERAVALLASGKSADASSLLKRAGARTRDSAFEALLRELSAVALLTEGKRDQAIEAFREVVREHPLSFGALAAAARLRALGQPLPPWLEPPRPGPTPPPLELKLPAEVAVLHRLGLERDAASALFAHERRLSRGHAPRSNEALCELYGQLEVADRRYIIGHDAATPAGIDYGPGPRSRWMWDCLYPRPYTELIASTERERLLPRGLLWAVMRQESGFRPAVRSPVGAVGLMQLMPRTAERVAQELGEEGSALALTRAHVSVRLGSAYLRKLLDTFNGNVPLSVASYNAGPHAVSRWLQSGESLPLDLFVARIPYDETRGYVLRVMSNAARYAYLSGGEAAVPVPALELPRGVTLPENSY